MNKLSFSIKSFGCKVNQYEEQLIRDNFFKCGFCETAPENADFLVVNSCTVTAQADKKVRFFIKRIKRMNPKTQIILTGCIAVLPQDIERFTELEDIDRIIPNIDKMKIPYILTNEEDLFDVNREQTISEFESHTRAFVRIQNGCDQNCSYCKVRIVRGRSVSKHEDVILKEIKDLLNNGYKELVLTGICIGSWKGRKGWDLVDLLEEIVNIKKEFRIRISSIEPNHINEKLINLIGSSDKICKHFHIPLQSGSNSVLKRMNRKYDTSYFNDLIKKIRSRIPFAGISLDIIAGFPGETDSEFQESLNFVRGIKPSRVHVFRYSDRKGTLSFDFGNKVPKLLAKQRVNEMIKYGDIMQKDFHRSLIGKSLTILLEKKIQEGSFEGYSSEYARVRLSQQNIKVGCLAIFIPQNFDEENMFLY